MQHNLVRRIVATLARTWATLGNRLDTHGLATVATALPYLE
jgi:hypothetical protein